MGTCDEAETMLAELTWKDTLLVLVTLGASLIALSLLRSGVLDARANWKRPDVTPDWGRLVHTCSVGAMLVGFGWVGLALSADNPLDELNTFGSLYDAHTWALRLAWLGLVGMGTSMALGGALPTLAAWCSQRQRGRKRNR